MTGVETKVSRVSRDFRFPSFVLWSKRMWISCTISGSITLGSEKVRQGVLWHNYLLLPLLTGGILFHLLDQLRALSPLCLTIHA